MQGVQPKAKAKPNAIGAKQAHRPRMVVVARFAVENGKLEHAEEMQAHQNDEHAGDLRKHAQMLAQQLPGNRSAGSQRHKDR